jgi:hypothetical protein
MTMTSLFREVLLPSAAAVALLFLAAIDVATAAEPPGVEPARIAAAPVPIAHHPTPRAEPPAEGDQSRAVNKPLAVERRCHRIQRIGKFTLTRCD